MILFLGRQGMKLVKSNLVIDKKERRICAKVTLNVELPLNCFLSYWLVWVG